jgi:heterodisulfide reductase subunit C
MDIPLGSLIQLVMANDDEVLAGQTLWSEPVLELARSACAKNLNLAQVILALRREALRRGVRE